MTAVCYWLGWDVQATNNTQLSYCSMTAVCYWLGWDVQAPITHSCHTAKAVCYWLGLDVQALQKTACTSQPSPITHSCHTAKDCLYMGWIMYRQSFAVLTAVCYWLGWDVQAVFCSNSCVLLVGVRCTAKDCLYISTQPVTHSVILQKTACRCTTNNTQLSYCKSCVLLVGLRCTGSLLQYWQDCVLLVGVRCTGSLLQYWQLCVIQPNQ